MQILVIDAQGGGIGKQIVAAIHKNIPNATVTAVGTNTAATTAMLKAGADSRFPVWRNHAGDGNRGWKKRCQTNFDSRQPL